MDVMKGCTLYMHLRQEMWSHIVPSYTYIRTHMHARTQTHTHTHAQTHTWTPHTHTPTLNDMHACMHAAYVHMQRHIHKQTWHSFPNTFQRANTWILFVGWFAIRKNCCLQGSTGPQLPPASSHKSPEMSIIWLFRSQILLTLHSPISHQPFRCSLDRRWLQ